MNRSVLDRQMFKNGGVVPMQAGGAPMPAAPMPSAPMPAAPLPSAPLPAAPMPAAPMPAVEEGIPSGVDPALMEDLLRRYSQNMEGLEDAEDYETVINEIRGDDRSIDDRYDELAGVVGEEDAHRTPESVLTLVQPVMLMASVDDGIGSLAQEEMMTPVEGPMAEGIMSTVDMGPSGQVEGGPAPVNFSQGGAVQYFAPENPNRVATPVSSPLSAPVVPIRTLSEVYEQDTLPTYQKILGAKDQEKAFQDQKRMTEAQMLFDIAQGALMFATPGERRMSPAERLAQSFTPVLGNIGTRAGELQKFKQSQAAQDQALKLQALGSAEKTLAAERAEEAQKERDAAQIEAQKERDAAQIEAQKKLSAAEAKRKPVDNLFRVTITNPTTGEKTTQVRSLTVNDHDALVEKHGSYVSFSKTYKPGAAAKAQNFLVNGSLVSAVSGTALYDKLVAGGHPVAGNVSPEALLDIKQYTLTMDINIGGKTYPKGSSPYLSKLDQNMILKSYGPTALTEYQAPVTDQQFFAAFKMSRENFEALPKEHQQYLLGLPVITEVMYFNKFGVDRNTFLTYPKITQQRLLNIAPEYRYEKINDGKRIDVLRFDVNDPEGKGVSIYSADIAGDPDFFKISMPSPDDPNVQISSIVDISTEDGRAMVAQINEINKKMPGAAVMQRIGTESTRMSAFLVPGDTPGGGASVRMSYDGGKTYIGSDGKPRLTPPNAFALSDTIAYDVYRREKVRSDARQWLNENDITLNNGQYFGKVEGGVDIPEITKKEKALVTDVLQQIRNGTGQWSAIGAAVNSVAGGFMAPETFSELFKETEEGRQFTQLVYVLGRSALASNPRFAVADLEVTGKLFPNPDKFFANPETEANKIVSLMKALDAEEIRLQQIRASASPVNSAQLAMSEQKLGEIARLKNLLGPVSAMVNTASSTDISGAQTLMQSKLPAAPAIKGTSSWWSRRP